MAQLKSVSPISGEDTMALPVKDLKAAIAFYQDLLGFNQVNGNATTSLLQRDQVQIGLIKNDDHEPEQAGSVAFAVDDLDEMHRELKDKGAKPGDFGIQSWNGKQHRTFFVKEDQNGYCFCYYKTLT